MLDVAGPTQVFTGASELAGGAEAQPYTMRLVAPGAGSVRATSGLSLATAPLGAAAGPLDMLIAGGQRDEKRSSASRGAKVPGVQYRE